MDENTGIFYGLSILVVALSFLFAFYLYFWVKKKKTENKEIERISLLIKEGAVTFMRREYRILFRFAFIFFILITLLLPTPIWNGNVMDNLMMGISYILGTAISALAGRIGVLVATLSNARCAEASEKSMKDAFLVAFRGGSVMGILVVGCSLLGVALVLMITSDASIVLGFSFGASSLALFAKKVELNIAEDDPRNPAVIADNVGDNVGDVAGMGADLFDSNVAALASSVVIASSLNGSYNNIGMILTYSFVGIIASCIGIACARMKKEGEPTRALNASTYTTTAIFIILTLIITLLVDGFALL